MEEKKSNLCLAADLTTAAEILALADKLGPFICILKTHVDIISDFTKDFTDALLSLSEKHNFLIFEDRKFADIGNTVKLQYTSGIYKISSWAHITNAHTVPGEGIITALKQCSNDSRGLLLLAEMSSKGTLASGAYTEATIALAQKHNDFCFGFIGQNRLENNYDFVYVTPGVSLSSTSDALGQQYRSPRDVILAGRCDVIVVGRGIYAHENVLETCLLYKNQGWNAYLERCKSESQ